jgi:hypothetical protein
MVGDVAESEQGMNAGAQAIAAVVVVGGLLAAVWGLGDVFPENSGAGGPAVCSSSSPSPDTRKTRPAHYVSGARLCTALNRPDLPKLLGTPTEEAQSASGDERSFKPAGGTEITSPEATVTFATYSVELSASDGLQVAEMAGYLGNTAEARTVVGHPAVLYSNRTIAISFGGEGKADTGPGGIARTLMVARDAKDGGGYFELAIWRQDSVPPDDAALLRVAEQVLPATPGWKTG